MTAATKERANQVGDLSLSNRCQAAADASLPWTIALNSRISAKRSFVRSSSASSSCVVWSLNRVIDRVFRLLLLREEKKASWTMEEK
jgi:hypothetical protein